MVKDGNIIVKIALKGADGHHPQHAELVAAYLQGCSHNHKLLSCGCAEIKSSGFW